MQYRILCKRCFGLLCMYFIVRLWMLVTFQPSNKQKPESSFKRVAIRSFVSLWYMTQAPSSQFSFASFLLSLCVCVCVSAFLGPEAPKWQAKLKWRKVTSVFVVPWSADIQSFSTIYIYREREREWLTSLSSHNLFNNNFCVPNMRCCSFQRTSPSYYR